ncbi:DUF1615 domain-containing protein [Azohydromonas caseinilytica]|uniref:DUF1615 domain-containing protein n=1 Tax=Azohydromonas caseinilytica TaxID=2728836 RepID=A0A848FAA9_9BURK|nr:DUF1615 domain-containing protein [Azohydromonas caseinilytica]NML16262.1 DUF1615 domain-containing protein [Azohydromonas caseinilytica]
MRPVAEQFPGTSLPRQTAAPRRALGPALWAGLALLLAGCAADESQRSASAWPRPQDSRALLLQLLPAQLPDRAGWATDIYAAFSALQIPPNAYNFCAALAVTEQESGFQADPAVPNLGAIARKEIDERAGRVGVPSLLVSAALQLPSSDGRSYAERIEKARTERQLSDTFEDLIERVPLGQRLFGKLNPVRTGGPMQVSVAWAEQHAERYPYPLDGGVRDAVFSRRGGLYFGIAHLLDYAAPYDRPLYRFADFNAGRWASRNAAFQQALSAASGIPLDPDGDLLRGDGQRGATEAAALAMAPRLGLGEAEVRRALEQGNEAGLERSALYRQVFSLAERQQGRALPRAVLPKIALSGPKISRPLSTQWFAERVQQRWQRCMARAPAGASSPSTASLPEP